MTSRPAIAYLLLEWPRYSETFILNEMLALASHGIPDRVFCLRGNPEEEIAAGTALEGRAEVVGGQDGDVALSLEQLAQLAEARPEAFAAAFSASWARYFGRLGNTDAERRREPLFALACAVRIAERCRALGIGHLHCHYAGLPVEVGMLVRQLSGIPFSFTGHAKDIFTMAPERLRRRIGRAAFAVTCSETGRRTLNEAADPDDAVRVHRVYHGLHVGDWKIERRPASSPVRIVSVGRLTPKKGFPALIEALAILRGRGHEITAEILGEGRERDALEQLAARLGVADSVALPGRLDQEAIRDRFRTATAFVLPSVILESNNQDGIANAVLEAMAASVPVVVSDIPALTEVVEDGITGLVFRSGDAVHLADRLEELITDSPLAERLASAGYLRVRSLDCSAAATQLAELFASYVR